MNVQKELILALKLKDPVKTRILRDLKNRTDLMIKDLKRELTEKEIQDVLQKMVKDRNKSIDMYKTGNRQDLVDIESVEVIEIEKYLPKKMNADEIFVAVTELSSKMDAPVFGTVMKEFRAKYPDQDGSLVASVLKTIFPMK